MSDYILVTTADGDIRTIPITLLDIHNDLYKRVKKLEEKISWTCFYMVWMFVLVAALFWAVFWS